MDDAADELARLLTVLDAYCASSSAACREIKALKDAISKLRRDGREFYD